MIQTASFVGLAKTILILLLAYSIFNYVMRLLSPWIIRSMARKWHKNSINHPQIITPKMKGI